MNNKDQINKKKQLMRTTAIGIGIAGLVWDTIVNQPMNPTSLILYFIALGLFAFSLYIREKLITLIKDRHPNKIQLCTRQYPVL